MRVIEIVADASYLDTLRGIAEQQQVIDVWCGATDEDGRLTLHMLVTPDKRQIVIDALQTALGGSINYRIVILSVDAVLPRPEEDEQEKRRNSQSTTREELYSQIERGARLDSNFLMLAFLSTVVAAIGLIEDNVAVVVGAMVIAPLLGPNIALAFASSLGDYDLMREAFKTNIIGLGMTLLMAVVIGIVWPVSLDSHEIMARTDVGLSSVLLAFASGAAAVLSMTTGLSSALVGVMVAVALLPPAAVFGMLLGSGQLPLASGALLLLAVNIVCVILSAKLVFLARGVRPRTWLEKRQARQSSLIAITIWVLLLVMLVVIILARTALQAEPSFNAP